MGIVSLLGNVYGLLGTTAKEYFLCPVVLNFNLLFGYIVLLMISASTFLDPYTGWIGLVVYDAGVVLTVKVVFIGKVCEMKRVLFLFMVSNDSCLSKVIYGDFEDSFLGKNISNNYDQPTRFYYLYTKHFFKKSAAFGDTVYLFRRLIIDMFCIDRSKSY